MTLVPSSGEAPQSVLRSRILVIDDNEVLARSFARMLRMYDTEVENDPRKAVARIHAGERFDLILCDLRMPTMSGVEVLASIRAHFEGRPGMPNLVMMSGSDELTEGDVGAPVLIKPCAAADVRALIARLVESAR
jgi:two-component system NtrC family sensor kinase